MRQQIRKVIYKSETAVSIDLCYCMGKQGNKRLRRHNSPRHRLSLFSLARTGGGRVRSSSSLIHTCHTRGSAHEETDKGGVMLAKQDRPSHYQLSALAGEHAGNTSHTSFPPVMD